MTRSDELDEYFQLVERGLEKIPTYQIPSESHRIDLPELQIHRFRHRTSVENFELYFVRLRREPREVMSELSRKIGVRLILEDGSLIFLSQVDGVKISELIDEYVSNFVRCQECEKLDTVLRKENDQSILRCEACGVERVVV